MGVQSVLPSGERVLKVMKAEGQKLFHRGLFKDLKETRSKFVYHHQGNIDKGRTIYQIKFD